MYSQALKHLDGQDVGRVGDRTGLSDMSAQVLGCDAVWMVPRLLEAPYSEGECGLL